jgi:predicted nuclease of predicted toxin-antitoxin system
VRLLFDENLSVLSAQWTADALAVDVLYARAAGLAGKTDREVRRFAIETDRILVTLDGDFGNLIRFSPAGTPGVIWLRPRPPTEANIRSILEKWLNRLRGIDLHGQLAVVEEDKLRVRGAIEE